MSCEIIPRPPAWASISEAPTAVPGSKPRAAAAVGVRPSPSRLPGGHVTLPVGRETDKLLHLLSGLFLGAWLTSLIYLSWKSYFPAGLPARCCSRNWSPILLGGSRSIYTPAYIKTWWVSESNIEMFFFPCSTDTMTITHYFTHRVKEPVAFQDRKSGRSKKWAALFQQLSLRFWWKHPSSRMMLHNVFNQSSYT